MKNGASLNRRPVTYQRKIWKMVGEHGLEPWTR